MDTQETNPEAGAETVDTQETNPEAGAETVDLRRDDGKVFSVPESEVANYLACGRFAIVENQEATTPCPITKVNGIGKQTAATLKAAGIDTLEDLRAAAVDPDLRAELVALRGITQASIDLWVKG